MPSGSVAPSCVGDPSARTPMRAAPSPTPRTAMRSGLADAWRLAYLRRRPRLPTPGAELVTGRACRADGAAGVSAPCGRLARGSRLTRTDAARTSPVRVPQGGGDDTTAPTGRSRLRSTPDSCNQGRASLYGRPVLDSAPRCHAPMEPRTQASVLDPSDRRPNSHEEARSHDRCRALGHAARQPRPPSLEPLSPGPGFDVCAGRPARMAGSRRDAPRWRNRQTRRS
jgi:hypothetical protein